MTDRHDTLKAEWEESVRIALLAEKAGIEAIIPVARWKGMGGAVNFNHRNFETFTWAAELGPRNIRVGCILPGAVSTEALSHKAQEGGFVLQGAVRVSVGDEVRVLKAGDGYYFDSRIPHSFENLSDGESKIVSAVTPPNY